MRRWNRVRNRIVVTLAIMSSWLAMPLLSVYLAMPQCCNAADPRVWLEVPDDAVSHTSHSQQLHREIHGLDCIDETHVRLLQRILGDTAAIESTDSVDLIVAGGAHGGI